MNALPQNILTDLRNTLLHLKGQGFTGFDCSEEALLTFTSPRRTPNTNCTRAQPQTSSASAETLADILADLQDCQRCKLAAGRTNIVFGDGSAQARLVFVGEGPGQDEDLQGIPFVGRAGKLLTRIIEAMGLQRSDVYICNIVKCRPPGNRNPEFDEIATCEPFLKRQLAVIKPEYICALGTFAAQTLLQTSTPISRLRGRFHTWQGIQLIPTFHPAYLLRNPSSKRQVWEDMQQLMRAMGLPIKAVAK